jgi:multidrug efflux pump subunit AcrA (membrane-fusion protein)
MPEDFEYTAPETPERHSQPRMHPIWYVAIVLALVGNVYLLFSASRLATGVAQVQQSLNAQIAKVHAEVAANLEASQQRAMSMVDETRQSAMAAAEQARADTRKSAAKLAAKLAQQQKEQQLEQKQVAGELSNLKQATSTADSRLTAVSSDVSGVKADVASTQEELRKTGSDLKTAMGDMGVMSGLIATNSKELGELRALGERNYFEFDIKKDSGPKKVGDVSLALRKADPKRNRFTVNLVADDKTVEKRDRTINEPVQFYKSGSRQPYEIVINQVKKDEVIGYLATPKVNLARR